MSAAAASATERVGGMLVALPTSDDESPEFVSSTAGPIIERLPQSSKRAAHLVEARQHHLRDGRAVAPGQRGRRRCAGSGKPAQSERMLCPRARW